MVTNSLGSVTSAVAVLTVLSAPVITTQPMNLNVMTGAGATFTVSALGTLPLSYQWLFNGAGVVGATGASLTLTNVQLTNGGSYAVVVTNIGCSDQRGGSLDGVGGPELFSAPSGLVGWWPGDGNANDIAGRQQRQSPRGGDGQRCGHGRARRLPLTEPMVTFRYPTHRHSSPLT